MINRDGDVTRLLEQIRDGRTGAVDQLLPLLYDELHALADSYLRRESSGHTLQPTALVHEAYLKLVDQTRAQFHSRQHFLAVAATAMRRILVNHARQRKRIKRGGDRQRIAMSDSLLIGAEPDVDLVALDEALTHLSELDRRKVQIVELRYFAGLSVEQTAEVAGLSPATVKRDWDFARMWLLRAIGADDAPEPGPAHHR